MFMVIFWFIGLWLVEVRLGVEVQVEVEVGVELLSWKKDRLGRFLQEREYEIHFEEEHLQKRQHRSQCLVERGFGRREASLYD